MFNWDKESTASPNLDNDNDAGEWDDEEDGHHQV